MYLVGKEKLVSRLHCAINLRSALLILNLVLAQCNAAMFIQQVFPGRGLCGVQLLHVSSRNKALAIVHLHLPPVLQQGGEGVTLSHVDETL